MKYIGFAALLLLSLSSFATPIVKLKKGMVIHSSVVISTETYFINTDTSLKSPLLIIEGSNIVIDFNHAILQGSSDKEKPNEFYGLAILVKPGSMNITIKNANIHGYKVAIMADKVRGLTIENSDLSYNYRQQLHSNLFREDVSDWMSYHHNENDEWLRYGAAIYLKDCNKANIKNNTITGGQCGLMMMRCDSCEAIDNNISFNSGIGIGMYRSNKNRIYHNRLDFNVRGFSFDHYYRGQDSAGILVFEQCNSNYIAFNSVTHSGDGFFLWAGQHTMDTGEGGCNDNTLEYNDFSYAPTNGVEVTFSRNNIKYNRIEDCDNGIWGGYSFQTSIYGNTISGNNTGIAIEHGQNNRVEANRFVLNKTAIKLWSRATQPSDWGYAKYRDTRSVGYYIHENMFSSSKLVYSIMGTDSIMLSANQYNNQDQLYKWGERLGRVDSTNEVYKTDSMDLKYYDWYFKSNKIPQLTVPHGREQMRITEWGPYNFKYPLLWLKSFDSTGIYQFEILCAKKSSKVKSVKGFKIISSTPSKIIAKVDSSKQERSIIMEYTGNAFVDQLGKKHAANVPYSFSFSDFDPKTTWDVKWYKWNDTNDPNKDYQKFSSSLRDPVSTAKVNEIDYTWWGAIGKGLPADSFATVAITHLNIPKGLYELSVTADDLVKVFIDGKEVINAWDAKLVEYDEYTNHTVRLSLKGNEEIKIVHVENTGLATLMFYMKPINK